MAGRHDAVGWTALHDTDDATRLMMLLMPETAMLPDGAGAEQPLPAGSGDVVWNLQTTSSSPRSGSA